jgi:acetyl esterase/lipase
MDRREAIGVGLLGAMLASETISGGALAETALPDGTLPSDSKEVFNLWPGTPPGGAGISLTQKITEGSPSPELYHSRSVSGIQTPGVFVYRAARPNGMGLLVIPGGGYSSEGMERGGTEIAQRFAAAGVTCFILRYRLPGEGWADRADVPLQDAQRAMRLLRANAAKYDVDPARLAAIGFSAGGHVSASLATRWDAKVYPSVDAADAVDAKPVVAGMMYPVITMGPGAHAGSRDKLLGPDPTPQQIAAYSCDKHVRADGPPSFLCLALDDNVVPPVENGVAMLNALHAVKVPVEMHMFQQGGHGFSIRGAIGKPCAAWPDLFLAWAAAQGFTPRPT